MPDRRYRPADAPCTRTNRTPLRDERGNGIVFGDVVAIDAAGRRFPGSAHHTANGIELRLAHAAVEAAAFPLELDPLIGTSIQAYAGVDADYPDVAYDAFSRWSGSWGVGFGWSGPQLLCPTPTLAIPNDPTLSGFSRYMANLTFYASAPVELSFSEPFVLTIL